MGLALKLVDLDVSGVPVDHIVGINGSLYDLVARYREVKNFGIAMALHAQREIAPIGSAQEFEDFA